ncbi:MAG TPA: hypothetical protein VLI41_13905 [Phenylobacterium sp.]|uniref:hypothetical protein n=1 Tax=Phenylobacterium sp. TaxID=1871053 RepID=UPI002C68155C|nr:hypothetical protein [Phenylobacterium sp.]HSV04288.1 hypothetical protein [Phenylobacterium sp.]
MRLPLILACPAAVAAACAAPAASAHAVVGNRFFPATLATDDPGVADELSMPILSSLRTGEGVRELDIEGEWSKRLTDKLGVSFGEAWTRLKGPDGETARGVQNLETTLKYRVLASPEREAIVAAGLSYEWGGSGAGRVGAERQSTITPMVYFGKGAGELPDSLAWARPFAVTGSAGYSVPTRGRSGGERNPDVLSYGLAVEYSLGYLASHVKDLGLPDFVNHLTPLVEASFERQVAQGGGARTIGTVNPGLIWSGGRVQLGAEAIVPINRQSGRGAGFMVQVHFFLDDLFPRSLGRPIW